MVSSYSEVFVAYTDINHACAGDSASSSTGGNHSGGGLVLRAVPIVVTSWLAVCLSLVFLCL